jgi:hypothetical protein
LAVFFGFIPRVVEVCSDDSEKRAVVRARFHLYCFRYKPAHAPRFSGEDSGVIVKDPVAEVLVVFRRRRLLWQVSPRLDGTTGLSRIHFPVLAGLEI